MGLLDLLTVFDWISPTIGMAQDAHYNLTSSEGKTTIWLNKDDLGDAIQRLKSHNIRVVSTCTVAGDPEAGIDVPDSQVGEARQKLGRIRNW